MTRTHSVMARAGGPSTSLLPTPRGHQPTGTMTGRMPVLGASDPSPHPVMARAGGPSTTFSSCYSQRHGWPGQASPRQQGVVLIDVL
jgi:hypothetical protein